MNVSNTMNVMNIKSENDLLFNELMRENEIPKSAQVLKKEVLNFIEFIEQIMNEYGLIFEEENFEDIILINEFFKRIDPVVLMNAFIKKVLPYAEQIKNNDQDYFEKNVLKIFSELPQKKVYFIYKIFVEEKISKEDKMLVWEYFNIFIKLIEKFKKDK